MLASALQSDVKLACKIAHMLIATLNAYVLHVQASCHLCWAGKVRWESSISLRTSQSLME